MTHPTTPTPARTLRVPEIAVVTDEVADTLAGALAFARREGIRRLELREEWGAGRFPAFSPAAFDALADARADGMVITAVSPGVFKAPVADGARLAHELADTLPRTVEAAARVGAATVIVFGIERPPLRADGTRGDDGDRARVIDLLRTAVDVAAQAGLVLAVENEPGFWIDTPAESAALIAEAAAGLPGGLSRGALRLNWDPANLHWGGVTPTAADVETVRPHLGGLHVKDFYPSDPGAPWRALGEGVTPWPSILAAVVASGAVDHVTLETHTLPREDASTRSLVALRRWLADAAALVPAATA